MVRFTPMDYGSPLNGAGGEGVVYRFDAPAIRAFLAKELESETPAALAIRAAGLLGISDVSDVPAEHGLRPRAQVGASIFGMENSIVYVLLDAYGAVETHRFPLTAIDGEETRLEKADLCPHNDPVAQVLNPARLSGPTILEWNELSRFLTEEGFSPEHIGLIQRAREMTLL